MENLYFKLLKEFESTGLSSTKSISPFIENNFKKPTASTAEPAKWWKENQGVDLFLTDVRHTGHFDFESYESSHICPGHWYDIVNVNARITIAGLSYLDGIKSNDQINKNSNVQTLAIMLTVLLTAITLIVTLKNSTSDRQIEMLQTHIRVQTQQLHTLQIQLSQATNELRLEKEAKKTSPRKN